MKKTAYILALAAAGWAAGAAADTTAVLRIQADQQGPRVSTNLFGIFFEEINCAGDGGLYAERVRNRSFEEPGRTNYWTFLQPDGAAGDMAVAPSDSASTNNLYALRLTTTNTGDGGVGVANAGFWGMAFAAGKTYDVSLYARRGADAAPALSVRLENASGTVAYASATLAGLDTNWARYAASLTAASADPSGRLAVVMSGPGTVWLDMISLFPRETYRGRTNGLRPDLAGMLEELRPSFLRFPGGCWVEGDRMAQAYRWKQTIGDPAGRVTMTNLWNYFSNNGLGYHEYLQLCEDLGAAPLFVINCGMSHKETVPLAEMGPYVQDALDAVEYANGDTNTAWGAERARNGHPAPFGLKYLEIGNENGGANYNDRYALFYDALKAQHPEVTLVADRWGGLPTSRPVEMVDEHYYSDPVFFANNATLYDGYSRAGPKIYVGEYAVTANCGQGNLRGAIGEAAFMTGLERNSDIVELASYAPLFANVNHKRWNPDLICFDGSRAYATPSWHVQQMFSRHRGDVVLPVDVAVTGRAWAARYGGVGLGAWNTQAEFTNVVVLQGTQVLYRSDFGAGAAEWSVYRGDWAATGGVYRQGAISTDCRSVTGDAAWSDYTLTLRARKLGGQEGFLILFHALDSQNCTWWNIGGWNNTRHAVEHSVWGTKSTLGGSVNGTITTGRWYDIRVELSGARIRCYLDGALVHDTDYPVAHGGAVGLGAWNTRAAYSNVVVARGTQTLYQSNFAAGAGEWTPTKGAWTNVGGTYVQSNLATDCRSTTGDPAWNEYTMTVRARKLSGQEGFLILFNVRDSRNYTWWNIGGWNNTQHAVEHCVDGVKSVLGATATGSVQTAQWYNVCVQVSGSRIRCYLDDVLIHDLTYPAEAARLLHASATYAEGFGQVIVKAVNVSGGPIAAELDLAGAAGIASDAAVVEMASTNAAAENSLAQPDLIAPVTGMLHGVSAAFSHTFPANSLTVLRLQVPPPGPPVFGLAGLGRQNDPGALTNGVRVRLSTFVTNAVSVRFRVETPGAVVTNGVLSFAPGELEKALPLPEGLPAGTALRVVLDQPEGGTLGDVSCAYFLPAVPDDDQGRPRFGWTGFDGRLLLYWTDPACVLWHAGDLMEPWARLPDAASPIDFRGDDPASYYRLIR